MLNRQTIETRSAPRAPERAATLPPPGAGAFDPNIGVDIPHSGVPGGGYDVLSRLPRDIDAAAAQRGAAEPEFGDLKSGAPDLAPRKSGHAYP